MTPASNTPKEPDVSEPPAHGFAQPSRVGTGSETSGTPSVRCETCDDEGYVDIMDDWGVVIGPAPCPNCSPDDPLEAIDRAPEDEAWEKRSRKR